MGNNVGVDMAPEWTRGEQMSLIDELEELEQRAREMIEGAETTEKLEAPASRSWAARARITGLMRMMGKIEPEERRCARQARKRECAVWPRPCSTAA